MNTFVRPQTYHLYDVYIISAFQCVSYWTINEKISITFLLTNNFACTLSYSINVITGFCLLLRFLHLHFLFSVCFFSLFRISNNFWMWKNVLLKFYSLTLISFCIFIARFTQDDDVLVFFVSSTSSHKWKLNWASVSKSTALANIPYTYQFMFKNSSYLLSFISLTIDGSQLMKWLIDKFLTCE